MTKRSPDPHGLFSVLAAIAACGLPLLACGTALAAGPATVDLPAQPLSRTVAALSHFFGVPVTVAARISDATMAPAVHATGLQDALAQAMAQAPYAIVRRPDGALEVVAADRDQVETIQVRARRNAAETGYAVDDTNSSTRTGTSLADLPQSTRIVTSALIADQQVQTIADALRNVSGTTVNRSNLQGANSYSVHGFASTGTTNGLLDPAGAAQPEANVERIEVLKGPASILSGADNLGGSVNIVTKKPTTDRLLDIGAMFGSFDDRKITFDGSDALDDSKKWSARIVGDYADQSRNYAGYKGRKEYSAAPSVRYKTRTVDVTAGVEVSALRQPQVAYAAILSRNGAPRILSPDHPVGPDNQAITNRNVRGFYEASINLSDWLTAVSRSHVSFNDTTLNMYGPAAQVGPRAFFMLPTNEDQKAVEMATDNYLRAHNRIGAVKNSLIAGMNFSHYVLNDYVPSPDAGDNDTESPIISLPGPFSLAPFHPAETYGYSTRIDQLGVYGQDLVEWNRFHLLGSIRHSSYRSSTYLPGTPTQTGRLGKTTPQVGLVVDLAYGLSAYGSYTKGFAPNFLIGVDGLPLPPQVSTNYEAGLKGSFLDRKLETVVSFYQLSQSNYYVSAAGFTNRYLNLPGLRTRGMDIDISGTILPGWLISGSFTTATFAFQSPLITYQVVAEPRVKYSIFTKYTVQSGPLKNLGAAIGAYGFSRSATSLTRSGYTLPSQHEIDLNAYYAFRRWNFNFAILNIENNRNYGVSATSTYITAGDPRTFRGTVSYSFF